jgi:hypothetical protein
MDAGTALDFVSGGCGMIQRSRGEADQCIARLMSTGSGREATSRAPRRRAAEAGPFSIGR